MRATSQQSGGLQSMVANAILILLRPRQVDLSVSGFGSPPTPSSRAAAALESAEARSRGRTDAFGAIPFSLAGRERDAASPAAVTAKSPRARKREWVK